MSNGPLVKDVEDLLLSQKKSRRRHGDLSYPITYCTDLADFDIWDHMFRVNYCKSLTKHQFAEPPALTLDLGCGSGFWVMEAAKQWQNSRIIGLDIAEIQPHLEHLGALSRRISWVNSNLLDGLPFPANHFDFIRIVGMGLAIPEDEWQPVLEEVYRVLKQGAVLEIIEEDLLFPSASSLLQKCQSGTSSPLNQSPLVSEFPTLPDPQHVRLPRKRSYIFSNKSSDRTTVSPDSSASSIAETITSTSSKSSLKMSNLLPVLYSLRQDSTATLTATPSVSMESFNEMEHPQNHTRLKIAWDAMLTTRFLSPNLLSVLPFYLTSASFSVKVHEAVSIPLPPNSGVSSLKSFQSMGSLRHPDRSGGPLFDFHPAFSNRSIKADGFSMRSSFSSGPRPQPHPWGTMHLAKITSVVKGCKDAIWLEYQKIYSKDALNILARTAPDEEDYSSQPLHHLVRKAFEVDWYNWDCDMTDRIGMRKNLLLYSAWAQPTSKDDQPDCQNWRDKLDGKRSSVNNNAHLVTAYNSDDLCRSVRAFTAKKL